jgi:hypothetical protein
MNRSSLFESENNKSNKEFKPGRDFANDLKGRPDPIVQGRTQDSNIRIELVKSYQVVVQERSGGRVTQESTITILEIQTQYRGSRREIDPVWISAEAKNTGNAPRQYSQSELDRMANIAKTIVEVSKEQNFDETIALGLARTETHMGTLPSHESSLAKQSDINPMQLSSTSGIRPTTDLRENIRGAIEVYNQNSRGSLNANLQDYNNQENKAAYARTAESHINRIRDSITREAYQISPRGERTPLGRER